MELAFFVQATALAAVGVVIVHQILKLKIIPLAFANRYPVPTNILLSIIAAIIAVYASKVAVPVTLIDWGLLVLTISVVAAIIYNNLLRPWVELKAMEGEKG